MIREFVQEDLERLEPNEFSDGGVPEGWWNYTLENEGIKAIICFQENEPNDWAGFFLISKHFTVRDGIEIKNFINMAVTKLKKDEPARLWTISRANRIVDAWHKWLGMKVENIKEINGKPYNEWVIRY